MFRPPRKRRRKTKPADKDKEAKVKAEKEKKDAELKALQNKRVARSPLEGRGAATNLPVVIIRATTLWTASEKGVLTNRTRFIVIMDGKLKQVGTLQV
jgi:hypothetical protein